MLILLLYMRFKYINGLKKVVIFRTLFSHNHYIHLYTVSQTAIFIKYVFIAYLF